jgi:GTPase SAR1 family protein
MTPPRYTASKSRTQGRLGWTINFRHPLRIDPRTQQGLKIRRGLGTSDEVEADKLVSEMNELLAEETYHRVSMRQEASRKFASIIVEAFYDGIENPVIDPWDLREKYLPLPKKKDGYSKVLFVGTTGAGKTSLLRHLIGSDPKKDRFPSTSPAKTTISDIEIITQGQDYEAVVTFLSESIVRTNIRECLSDACLAASKKVADEKLVTRLLNHRDQKFRLGYILGKWQVSKDDDDIQDDWEDEKNIPDGEEEQQEEFDINSEEEANKIQLVLKNYIERIRQITEQANQELGKELGQPVSEFQGKDVEAAEELFDEKVQSVGDFDNLVNDIVDEIKKRFDNLNVGKLYRRSNGWAEVWTYDSQDREIFLANIRQFSSNHARSFGKLLTPIVQGIRVKGAFDPIFTEKKYRLVLMDGQGLGHTPDLSVCVTTHITNRFDSVDVILLVDNAQQPIQATSLSVIRTVASSGYQQKLAIAFTHFDNIKGDNLPTFADKKNHVLGSVINGLNELGNIVGHSAIKTVEQDLDRHCFMLGGLDRSFKKMSKRKSNNNAELERLLDFCGNSSNSTNSITIAPVYDPYGLSFAVQKATNSFQEKWTTILGLGQSAGVQKEHWRRIKALNKRFADSIDVEYDNLRPVADLLTLLNESISQFLDNPISWTEQPNSHEEAQQSINSIRQKVSISLHDLIDLRIARETISSWIEAYRDSGRGESIKRANKIKLIFNEAVPEISLVMNRYSQDFLRKVHQLVHEAIKDVGGKLSSD